MSSALRLHEVAKLLGTTAKILMTELGRHGIEVKTHMVVVDEKIVAALEKNYPQIREKVAGHDDSKEPSKEPATAPKKTRTTKATGSKVVTSRTATTKRKPSSSKKSSKESEAEAEAGEDAASEVALLQREEGQAGTVTLEQRVVKEGVLRRRRVEPSQEVPQAPVAVTPPAEELPSEPAQYEEAIKIEAEEQPLTPTESASARRTIDQSSRPILRRVAPTPPEPPKIIAQAPPKVKPAEPVEPAVEAPVPATPAAPRQPRTFGPPSTGRNLSAPSRLKIVDQPAIPPTPARAGGGTGGRAAAAAESARARRPLGTPAAPTATSEGDAADKRNAGASAARRKPAAAGGGGKPEEAPQRVTKKDLLGMMEEVEIQRPMGGRRPKKAVARVERKSTQITTPGLSKRKIRIENEITVADLADRMGIKGADIVRKLIGMGQMVSLQQVLDFDTASLIASDYQYEVQNVAETAESLINLTESPDEESAGVTRPPIVTVMGHVDHGKTSLLDYIRKAKVVAGEAGGITQHIGAYQVVQNGKKITFIDTPGHAAFTAMRARGASLTDIVILVVAADEGVKPQTLEALAHAKAAKVPVIVAINKMDKADANPDRVIQELSNHQLVPEEWGGDTMFVRVSAHTGDGMTDLLERILIQAEVLDLKANPQRNAKGIVIESRLDKGKGSVATIIVQTGTLKVGSPIVSGSAFGKVRAMFNDQGKMIQEAGPSVPVEILGLDAVPAAGDLLTEVNEDAIARRASELSQLAKKKADALKSSRMSLEDMYKKMQAGDVSELRVILKGDVQGSVEAIADSLLKITHEKVRVSVLFKAVGAITESDVDLAAASGALILGFNVRPTAQAKAQATHENVQIKTYEIIYELLDEVKLAMQGLLAPIIKENTLGMAECREVFTVSKVGPIAGCFVKQGKITRNGHARVLRDSVVVYTTKIGSLRRFKDDAKEVAEGFECGIRLDNFTDLKPGDIIECFETIETRQAVG